MRKPPEKRKPPPYHASQDGVGRTDTVKAIYRVFGVSSRPELLASHIRRHTTAKAKLGRSKRKSPV
jgi:hypothetical protein